ncbi:MAG: hypothetical protein J6W23_02925 [Victivallales bacterium]|nr:hypothetical protein [Victivallales bacterium]
MRNQPVIIIHLILIVILAIIGCFLFMDMRHVDERHPNVEIVKENTEGEDHSEKGKPISSRMTKAMREEAVKKIAEALDDMTAEDAYDWFQGILEKDIQTWRNPSSKSLDDSVERRFLLDDELGRLDSLDYVSIEDMMRRAEDPDYLDKEVVVRPGQKRTTAGDLHAYLAEQDMSQFDAKFQKQFTDFNARLGGLLEKMNHAQEIQEEDCQLALELLREFNETLKTELLKQHWGADYVILGEMTSQPVPIPVFYKRDSSMEKSINESFIDTLSGYTWLYPLKQPEQE